MTVVDRAMEEGVSRNLMLLPALFAAHQCIGSA